MSPEHAKSWKGCGAVTVEEICENFAASTEDGRVLVLAPAVVRGPWYPGLAAHPSGLLSRLPLLDNKAEGVLLCCFCQGALRQPWGTRSPAPPYSAAHPRPDMRADRPGIEATSRHQGVALVGEFDPATESGEGETKFSQPPKRSHFLSTPQHVAGRAQCKLGESQRGHPSCGV